MNDLTVTIHARLRWWVKFAFACAFGCVRVGMLLSRTAQRLIRWSNWWIGRAGWIREVLSEHGVAVDVE